MVSVDKETGKILAEQCEQPEDILNFLMPIASFWYVGDTELS